METTGKYFESNQKKLGAIDDNTLKVAISKCKKHIESKLWQRTLYGVHTSANLGEDPVRFYFEDAIDAVISGRWEWKDKFDLANQLIRIVDSKISTEIEKSKTTKAQSLQLEFIDPETELYKFDQSDNSNESELRENCERQISIIECALKDDPTMVEIFEYIKAGYKRSEIAEIMEITPKRYDKLIEQLKDKVLKSNSYKSYSV